MATNKKSKGSGFDAPVIGERVSKGTKFKVNSDGTITPIKPAVKKGNKKAR